MELLALADIFWESSSILIFCFLASELLSNDAIFILHFDKLFWLLISFLIFLFRF